MSYEGITERWPLGEAHAGVAYGGGAYRIEGVLPSWSSAERAEWAAEMRGYFTRTMLPPLPPAPWWARALTWLLVLRMLRRR